MKVVYSPICAHHSNASLEVPIVPSGIPASMSRYVHLCAARAGESLGGFNAPKQRSVSVGMPNGHWRSFMLLQRRHHYRTVTIMLPQVISGTSAVDFKRGKEARVAR